jgi:diphosphomevalonate decarboxylase
MSYISSWRSPSNIALVKYWGKYGVQLPRNPSLSFTLSSCHTDMKIQVTPESSKPELTVLYDGNAWPSFEPKIKIFFNRVLDQLPWLTHASIVIDSVNTFPYGAGIASSASSMSALALCLVEIDDQIHSRSTERDAPWRRRVSQFARLGSGSACRSVFPVASLWGEMRGIHSSMNEYAIPWSDQVAPVYHDYQDTILVVSSSEKSVSSSLGHDLMIGHVYEEIRYELAKKNLERLIASMRAENNFDPFISVCEAEALQLHALMMTGRQPFILMAPDTIAIIKEVWRFRRETKVPVCFTLDAGPNVHLLYPFACKATVLDFIKNNLARFCKDGQYILDQVGSGPEKLKENPLVPL